MKTTRIIAAVLSICMLGGAVGYDAPLFEGASVTANAAKQQDEIISGTCGENASYTFSPATGVLEVDGTGDITDAPWIQKKELEEDMGMWHMVYFYVEPWSEEYVQSIKTVILSEGITNISFEYCSSLTSISIPKSVESIRLYNCPNLSDISIPEGVTGVDLFKCTSLDELILPDSVKSVSITYCSNITSLTIPDGVTTINYSAFRGCTNLKEIVFPASIKEIRDNSLIDTPWLSEKEKEDPLVIVNNIVVTGRKCKGNVAIPEGITSIVPDSFSNNENITSITFPSTCIDLSHDVLQNCKNLKKVYFLNPEVLIKSATDVKLNTDNELHIDEHWSITDIEAEPKVPVYSPSGTIGYYYVTSPASFSGTIYGYSGSTAEAFAKDYCKFEVIDQKTTKGDLNNDTMIDGRDATLVLAMYADSSSSGYVPTNADRAVGDVNSDTFIDGRDATIILAYYADLSAGASISFENYLKENNYV